MNSMLRWCFIMSVLWLPLSVRAQSGIITGTIINASTKSPVQKASVFLSNATFGTASQDDGTFNLRGIKPGQYDLVVTILGYEAYTQRILVGIKLITVNIELTPKVMMMKAVTIISNADWKKNYEQFKRDFIGVNDNARHCKVINPRVLDLIYHRKTQTLEATADEFLIVENNALGYRIKFLLNNFSSDNITNTIAYGGRVLFEDLYGNAAQKRKWQLKRDEAYYGSPQHFYRALYKNQLAGQGFVMYDFTRIPNPVRSPEELIQRKFKQFNATNQDSARYWKNQEDLSKWANETLKKPPLTAFDIVRKTPQEGVYVITFPHYLYVTYTKKREDTYFKDIYRPLDMENFETSVITLFTPYAAFDMNGTIVSDSPLYEGTWSKAKLASLLPVDYEPGN